MYYAALYYCGKINLELKTYIKLTIQERSCCFMIIRIMESVENREVRAE